MDRIKLADARACGLIIPKPVSDVQWSVALRRTLHCLLDHGINTDRMLPPSVTLQNSRVLHTIFSTIERVSLTKSVTLHSSKPPLDGLKETGYSDRILL